MKADADRSVQVWIVSLIRLLRVGRLAAGCLLSLGLGFWFWLVGGFEGGFAEASDVGVPNSGSAAFFCVFLPYVIVSSDYILEATRRALADLRPVLDFSDAEFDEASRQLDRFSRRELGWTLGLGSLAGIGHTGLIARASGTSFSEEISATPLDMTFTLTTLMVWLSMTAVMTLLTRNASRFARFGQTRTRIQLLHIRTVHPFGRVAVLPALGLLAGQAAYPLLWIGRDFNPLVVLPGFVATLVPTLFLFAMPLWSLHRRIREAKSEVLASLQERIGEIDRGEDLAVGRIGELAPLLSFRASIEGVSEWPFDAPVLFRFAFYVLIPPVTWVAAALMENWIDTLV